MKKVLSFVLVLSLVLSSFSMAFAGEVKTGLTDIEGVANEEAITVVNDLGIVTGYEDGTFKADKAVKRAEFAVMLTKALGVPESALAGYTATNFTDVAGYEWAVPYLAFCESKGIMSGYGEGIVKPGNTITVNEAVTMALRAVGYTPNSADLVGTWPANYVTKAQDLGLYADVAAVATVDRGSAAQIIYNSLTVDKVQVAADGTTKPVNRGTEVLPDYANMLTEGLGCVEAPMLVGQATYESIINLQKYMGLYGTAYLDGDDVVVAFVPESVFVEGDWTTGAAFVLGGYVDGDKEYKFTSGTKFGPKAATPAAEIPLTVATEVPYFVNGDETVTTTSLSALGAQTYTFTAEVVGKTITRVHAISAWTVDYATQVKKADLDDFEDLEFMGFDFTLDANEEIDYNSFELVGVNSLSDIEVDDVVYIYKDINNDINKIAVGQKEVTGDVTKHVDAATVTKFYVNGTKYVLSGEKAGLTVPAVGDNVTMYLDAYGNVYDYVVNSTTPDTYAVVKGYAYANNNVDVTRVKLFNSEDKTVTYNVVDNTELTISTGSAIPVTALANTTMTTNMLIGYGLDKDGNIEAINGTAATSSALTLVSTKVLKDGATTYPIASDVVVFTFDGTDVELSKLGDVKTVADNAGSLTGGSIAAASFILNSDGEVAAMLVDATAVGKATEIYGVANESDLVYDANLEKRVYNFVGYADGEKVEKNTINNTTLNANTSAVTLYKIEYNAEGYITSLAAVSADANANGVTINAIAADGVTIGVGNVNAASTWFEIGSDAVVYEALYATDGTFEGYRLSSVGSLKASTSTSTYTVYLYDTDNEVDGYEVVIYSR